MTERIAQAAEQHDLTALFVALQIGRRDGDDARALLVEQGRFAAIVDTLLAGVSHQSPRVRSNARRPTTPWWWTPS